MNSTLLDIAETFLAGARCLPFCKAVLTSFAFRAAFLAGRRLGRLLALRFHVCSAR